MNNLFGYFLIFISALSWSTAGLFTRIVLTDMATTIIWRSFFGAITVLIFYFISQKKIDFKESFTFTKGDVVTAVFCTFGTICFISSFYYTSIANVSFTYGLMPLMTYLLAIVVLKQAQTVYATFCCLLSAFGAFLIFNSALEFDDIFGIVLALGMTFFMASLTISAKFYPNTNGFKIAYLSGFMGVIVMLPFATYTGISITDYLWLLLYGFVNIGLGFGVYVFALKYTSALSAGLIGLSEIPIAPVLAFVLFAESISFNTFIGGSIIILSAIIYVFYSGKNSRNHP